MQTTTTNMTTTVLNFDVLSIINVYKTSYDKFEEHREMTKKLREQFSFIKKVILDTEETRFQYQDKVIVNADYGGYILDWIEDEKQARYQEQFDEFFEVEIDYGF